MSDTINLIRQKIEANKGIIDSARKLIAANLKMNDDKMGEIDRAQLAISHLESDIEMLK